MFEIIGVIADAKNRGIQDPPGPEMFIPYTVTGAFERGILVRTRGDPGALLNSGAARNLGGGSRRGDHADRDVEQYLARFSYAEPRFSLVLLGVFSAVGLVLVAIGVYSVIAYTVSRQTHEIGIRMALGAARGDVLKLVSLMGMKLLGIGTVIGLAGGIVGSRLIESQLWTVSRFDPLTFAVVTGLMTTVGLAACYFPARRAMRVDPIVALRYE